MIKVIAIVCVLNLIFSAMITATSDEKETSKPPSFDFNQIFQKLESVGRNLVIPGVKTMIDKLWGVYSNTTGSITTNVNKIEILNAENVTRTLETGAETLKTGTEALKTETKNLNKGTNTAALKTGPNPEAGNPVKNALKPKAK